MQNSFDVESLDKRDSIGLAVVEQVGVAKGVDSADLPPLYESIGPDALDMLFVPSSKQGPVVAEVSFLYDGYQVTVSYDGEVVIETEPHRF